MASAIGLTRTQEEDTHRSSGDKLDAIADPLEAKGGKADELGAAAGGPMGDPMGGMGGEVPMGEVLPGEEKAPRDANWEPGPDGSTDVGKEKEEVSTDVFVGKSNEQGWEAGPEGSNQLTGPSISSKSKLLWSALVCLLPRKQGCVAS